MTDLMTSREAPPRVYINTTCKVGQSEPCGREATHVIAVTSVADTAHAEEARPGGAVGLCDYHARTAVADWESASGAGAQA